MNHYTKLDLSLDIDPNIGSFIESVLDTADNDPTIKPFNAKDLNTYYLDSHNVSVLKYMNPNGTAYYGVFGNYLLNYLHNWTDIRNLLIEKNVTWQPEVGVPEFPETVCNNYGSTPHVDQLRYTGLNFIIHEDKKLPFCFFNDNNEVIEECWHENKAVLFNAKATHGTGIVQEKNIRVIISFCMMDSYESMKEKLKEYII